jgi:putative MATE family efflux protein
MALVALAGQGWLRGMSDLRTPLVIVVVANAANVVLEVLFVYGFDWGLKGSAWGTVLAQLGMGCAFAVVLLRAFALPDLARIRSLVSIGAQLVVRTAALLGCFVLATAVCAHIGPATVAAHQIAFQLYGFLALVLDAIAIAGQVIVGRALGAGSADEAIAAARRMIELSLVAGLVIGLVFLALADVVPQAFTSDPKVIDQAHDLWPLFCVMWPVAAIAFALDGILIGAGDTAYMALAMAISFVVFAPIVLAANTIAVVWLAIDVLMVVRVATLGARFARRRWALVGAHA